MNEWLLSEWLSYGIAGTMCPGLVSLDKVGVVSGGGHSTSVTELPQLGHKHTWRSVFTRGQTKGSLEGLSIWETPERCLKFRNFYNKKVQCFFISKRWVCFFIHIIWAAHEIVTCPLWLSSLDKGHATSIFIFFTFNFLPALLRY